MVVNVSACFIDLTSHVKLEVILCIAEPAEFSSSFIQFGHPRLILRPKRVHTDISSRHFLGFQIKTFRVPVVFSGVEDSILARCSMYGNSCIYMAMFEG